jgi:hypothetical protein
LHFGHETLATTKQSNDAAVERRGAAHRSILPTPISQQASTESKTTLLALPTPTIARDDGDHQVVVAQDVQGTP